ncbi:PREDICTED: uncharacterized protein LOC109588965 [Amphimedon queenslandica]|uniref:COR domain-containing protein n=1 Tax=Amphimedon queenslandica TaxID=400682 RepID=A0AAN0JUQ6_AMPQE|nr:PREDICTED: uncharacterized protein LOC109588965 [Amphimedon queenslandica]|eukprot:XP_019860629.1 PREDICTED: uncharacterized protein LOC109588965 [Amphimedon queenslandica]
MSMIDAMDASLLVVADLFSAYSSGDIDRVISLIDAGASPFTTNDEGNTLFHLCCTNNTDGPRILKRLLTVPSIEPTPFFLFYLGNNDGDTLLHLACINEIIECVQLLLSRSRATDNTLFELTNNAGLSPLYYASKAGHIDIVTLAISKYGPFNIDNIIKCIDVAASWQIIQLLLIKITLRDMMNTCNEHEHTQHLLRLFPMDNEYFQLSDGMTTVLHLAATSGDLEYFTTIVSFGFDINRLDSDGYTPLHRAIEYSRVSIAKYLISQPNCLCEKLTKNKDITPLLDAAIELGDLSLVQGLVERGVDVNISNCNGATALHYSCRCGHLSIVEYLTSLPQINYAKDTCSRTSIHFAAEFGQVHIVKYLVESCNHDINIEDKYGNTPLYMACIYNHLPVVEYLTGQPNCNINSNNETHPLLAATDKEHLEIVKHFIESTGCDINVREKGTGSTPLHKACYNGSLSIVEYLISKPRCDIEAEDNEGNQPLHYAACQGHKEIVSIVGKKVSIDGLSKCMESAKQLTEPDIMDLLNNHYKDRISLLNACDWSAYTPLHCACENGHFEIVKILTNHPQCNIEAERFSSDKPLHKACESGNVNIVHHLVIDKHCDVNAKGRFGYTPLLFACEKGHFEIVKFLTNHPQCNIEAENEYNDRPLHVACQSKNVNIVRHLVIDKHCDVNAKGKDCNTPLHYACQEGSFEIVKFLTNHLQCNTIEAENNKNKRPLHSAISHRPLSKSHLDIVNYLVEVKGCSVEEIKDLYIYQSSGIALLRVVKCILTGPPGAGKSTLKKRLLNQSLDTGPSLSTGVIDAAVQVNSFRKLSQHNAVVTTEWKEQELDEEAILISKKLLPANNTSDESIGPTAPHQSTLSFEEREALSFGNKSRSPKESDLSYQCDDTSVMSSPRCMHSEVIDASSYNKESSIMKQKNIADSCRTPVNCEEEETTTNTDVQDCSSSVKKGFSDYVMKIPVRKREEYEKKLEEGNDDSHTMLHIIDTGGQPEFHEILPALITGPAINLLVFKLTEDLRSRYEIIYRTSSGDSKPYETSLTHEEVIFRSLASIACLRQNTIGWSFDEIPIEDKSEPVAFLIATHRDQVDENKVSEVNQQLRTTIENSSHLFDSDLIQFSQSEQVIFPLDTTKDEKEVEHLRSLLHEAITKKFEELKIPASWCALSLRLRKSKRKLFNYRTCFQLAQECGIKDTEEFKNVLWYLHHRVGIIMHYPNVAGLEDIIITDLQLVFDRITNLITTCFTFEQLKSAAVRKEFHKNGRFSESQLDKIALQEKGNPLNTKRLVALLKHLYIVAGPMKTKVDQKTVNYYFMPCALKPAGVEREERDGSVSPAPLLICFECGYTPVGVFCCLVVYLLDQQTDQVLEWKLTGNDQYRNRITFQVGQYYDSVTLISHATYLEVWVQQQMNPSLNDLCEKILSSLDKGLVTVTQSLHYTYKSKHMFGVPCTCTGVPHPAVIEYCSEGAKCTNGNIMQLGEKHLYWSKKVVDLNTGAQKSNKSQPSGNVAATKNEVLPKSIFQSHLADITDAISSDVTRVAVDFCTKSLIPTSLNNDLASLLGVSDFDKANRITSYIYKHIISNSTVEAAEYLTTVCNVLYQRDHMRLKNIAANICKELGKPVPKGKKQTKLKRVHTDDDNALRGRQSQDMQGEMSVNERLKLSELSETNDDTQSSSNISSVLGLERHSEDETSESVLTNKKQRLLTDDDDDDDSLPSPLNKGYGKKLTGNKLHKIKNGQPSHNEVRKRKENEDHDRSSRSKRFKISRNNDTTEETTIEQESSLSHNADLLLEKKPQMSDLIRLFQCSDTYYMIIGIALEVEVYDLLLNPQSTTNNLIQVFKRWLDSNNDVTWRNILQVCEDYPDQLGKAKSDVNKFLLSDRASRKYLK